jgi:hypothetical protein
MARLYEFPLRSKRRSFYIRRCLQCGGHFKQQALHHSLCPVCFYWDDGITHLALASVAFARVGSKAYR